MSQSNYENKQAHIPELETPDIEVFKNIYQGRRFHVKLEILEFTAICPKTSLPDFGEIIIDYIPDEYCLELKSVKEYFYFYRDVGIFHENLVNRALEDLTKACSPLYMKLKAVYHIRGGIKTTVSRKYKKP